MNPPECPLHGPMHLTSDGPADLQVSRWFPLLTGQSVRRYDCHEKACGIVIVRPLSTSPNKPTNPPL